MWHAIQEAKNQGLVEFDFGRSDWDNGGLLAFKDRWDTVRSTLTYFRYTAPSAQGEGIPMRLPKEFSVGRQTVSCLPPVKFCTGISPEAQQRMAAFLHMNLLSYLHFKFKPGSSLIGSTCTKISSACRSCPLT